MEKQKITVAGTAWEAMGWAAIYDRSEDYSACDEDAPEAQQLIQDAKIYQQPMGLSGKRGYRAVLDVTGASLGAIEVLETWALETIDLALQHEDMHPPLMKACIKAKDQCVAIAQARRDALKQDEED